jgi:LysM repeat protein
VTAWSRRGAGRALRAAAWTLAALVALAVAGFALSTPRYTPREARAAARAQLALVLDPGEVVEQAAFVSQRSWWNYFHETQGVLAATDRRLIFVGVEPRGLMDPDADAPPAFEVRSWGYDSITVRPARVFPGAASGLALTTRAGRDEYAASRVNRPSVRRVAGAIERRQAAIREAAARERAAQLAAAEAARQPVYHTVERGEALISIAQKYNTTPEVIQQLNNLRGSRIKVGQRLLVKPRT